MGFFDDLKAGFNKSKETLLKEVSKFRNATFLEGVLAAAVVISAADGNISSEEKKKLMAYVQNSEELKIFETKDVVEKFNKVAGLFDFDADIGKAEALKIVGRLRDQPEQARMLVRVAVAIANSDGVFDESEQKVFRQICSELNLRPEDFV